MSAINFAKHKVSVKAIHDIVEVHCFVATMRMGNIVSFEHSITFNRLQDSLISRSSSTVIKI